jgi:hypothetical protein
VCSRRDEDEDDREEDEDDGEGEPEIVDSGKPRHFFLAGFELSHSLCWSSPQRHDPSTCVVFFPSRPSARPRRTVVILFRELLKM